MRTKTSMRTETRKQAKMKTDLEINLQIDYDLLESLRCLCGLKKDPGQKMCENCWRRLSTEQQAKLAGLRAGDGVADAVARMVGHG
jgi:uncharacterized membrane protein